MLKLRFPNSPQYYFLKTDTGETFIATNQTECLVVFIPETGSIQINNYDIPYKKEDGQILQQISSTDFMAGVSRICPINDFNKSQETGS